MIKLNVMGTNYSINYDTFENDIILDENDGYCDFIAKKIVIAEQEEDMIDYKKVCLRHEILHAFLYESGLESSSSDSNHWAMNEEMIDWFAIQMPKLIDAYEKAGAL